MLARFYQCASGVLFAGAALCAAGVLSTPAYAAETTYTCTINAQGNNCDNKCNPSGASKCDVYVKKDATGSYNACNGCYS